MSQLTLTKTRLFEGVWEGRLTGAGAARQAPELTVTLHDSPVDGVEVQAGDAPGEWRVKVPVPPAALHDGVSVVTILDSASGETLASFGIMAGESVDGDLRAEMQLLRDELDMLKRAFRRHCRDSA